MRVGRYTLELFCDNTISDLYRKCTVHHKFNGANYSEALKKARKHGWKIGSPDLCPVCAKR